MNIMGCQVRRSCTRWIGKAAFVFRNITEFLTNLMTTSWWKKILYPDLYHNLYEGVSRSFRTGRLDRELQIVQLFATRCSCITIPWVSLVSFAAITLCVACQRVLTVVAVYFVVNWVRKLLDTPEYVNVR